MNDLSLKEAMVGVTPQEEIKVSEPAAEIQTQPLAADDELAIARKMGLSPERYQAVTGRPYPVAHQQAQPDQSAATLGAAPTHPAVSTAQRGVVPEKFLGELLKQELARQPNTGPDEPISALERAKLRAGAHVGGVILDK